MIATVLEWATHRGLKAFPEADGEGCLLPHAGDAGVWTTHLAAEDGWIVLRAMLDLEVGEERIDAALAYVAFVSQLETQGVLLVDPRTGQAATRTTSVLPDGEASLRTVLDVLWETSVRVTGTWVPGLRDVASGISPEAAVNRIAPIPGGPW